MEGKDPPVSKGHGPSLKRSRQEKEELEKAEEEEGLLALMKKRRPDVKVLISRIQTLEAQLKDSKNELTLAEALLETMRPGKSDGKAHKEPPDQAPDNGHVRKPWPTSINAKPADNVGSSDGAKHSSGTAVPKAGKGSSQSGEDQPANPRRDSLSRSNKPEADRKDRKEGSGVRTPSEADRRDRKEKENSRSAAEVDRRERKEGSGGREQQEGERRDKRERHGSARGAAEAERKDLSNQSDSLGREGSNKASNPPPPAGPPPRKHVDLITDIKSQSKAKPVSLYAPVFRSSQHRRKMRCLILNPANETQCATSGLDGLMNFWRLDAEGLDISNRYNVECFSPLERHWPEDMTWHPEGHSIFAIYTAPREVKDSQVKDSQVAIIRNDMKSKVAKFLPAKPHIKGVMNAISFMPWSNSQFVTAGSGDHMVVLWKEECEDEWIPKILHQNHTSAVSGIAGTVHKHLVLSVGMDKRFLGFDPAAGRTVFQHQLDTKALSVLANPADFNLFMVQTGTPERQLHLYDIRAQTELHSFGWMTESTDRVSALITQSWSPDGYYIASGSADPKIPIFDIRYNSPDPAQTILAHKNRVFMAVWHHSLPMILSISSDKDIGVHRIYK
ncbi:hypothetical protein R1sor_016576 [Riccia sorocarpa]|uniref:Uncharacterized protein n=1 Tax=Riccia sorocarpa TaxID=122646 RepID=A0ABD3HIP0_9MARC